MRTWFESWICTYCGYKNKFGHTICRNCAAVR